jgi:hypothetical protein
MHETPPSGGLERAGKPTATILGPVQSGADLPQGGATVLLR